METIKIALSDQKWQTAIRGLSLKHAQALSVLYLCGYEPIYQTRVGSFVVLGRTTAYEAMAAEGYTYDDSRLQWIWG